MSSSCGNCDCADKTNCVKKGSTFLGTKKSYDPVVMATEAAENDGKCKCGASCSCTDCTCGH